MIFIVPKQERKSCQLILLLLPTLVFFGLYLKWHGTADNVDNENRIIGPEIKLILRDSDLKIIWV
jgi:hypothetical protein